MKTSLLIPGLLLIAATAFAQSSSQPLSQEAQRRIVADYLFAMGQLDSRNPLASAVSVEQSGAPLKCATPAILAFQTHRRQIDPAILGSLSATATTRPINDYTYDTPGGHFKIHYSKSGLDAVYQPTTDGNGNGVPDFVDGVAQAAEYVYNSQVNVMDFTAPPADDFYTEGGDARYDIYLKAVSSTFYGLAYPDVIVGDSFTSIIATSFIVLDNDYRDIEAYKDRPLDAARVTLAHEFFHAVQFGIDFTEFDEGPNGTPDRPWWMEMSATWMEEHLYDGINDYYAYLPYFYRDPRASLQQFKTGFDAHAYGAVVWPLYLSQKFGDGIIKAIWDKCGQLGLGSHALIAFDQEIDSISANTMGFSTAFNEFNVWNFFTGEYAPAAPNNIGFAEKENYPVIPVDSMARHDTYPFLVVDAGNPFRPQFNGVTYVRFEDASSVLSDYWHCTGAYDPDHCDSLKEDTVSLVEIDSLCCNYDTAFSFLAFGRNQNLPWVLSLIYQLESPPDSFFVEQYPIENTGSTFWTLGTSDTVIVPHNPKRYRSVTLVATSNTSSYQSYQINKVVEFAYAGLDSTDSPVNRTTTTLGVLTPYPNPAVVGQMNGRPMTFRFQLPLDSLGAPDASLIKMKMDVFSLAGERVASVEGIFNGNDSRGTHPHGVFSAEWDMTTDSHQPVASGAYLVYARLYTDPEGDPVAEKRVKVAVIR